MLSLRFPADQARRLDVVAKHMGMTLTGLICAALNEWEINHAQEVQAAGDSEIGALNRGFELFGFDKPRQPASES